MGEHDLFTAAICSLAQLYTFTRGWNKTAIQSVEVFLGERHLTEDEMVFDCFDKRIQICPMADQPLGSRLLLHWTHWMLPQINCPSPVSWASSTRPDWPQRSEPSSTWHTSEPPSLSTPASDRVSFVSYSKFGVWDLGGKKVPHWGTHFTRKEKSAFCGWLHKRSAVGQLY